MCSQTETMYKSKTTWRKLYILCCLITHPQNGGRGGGAYSRGGSYFKFRPIGGAPYSKGSLIRRGGGRGGANSKIYGNGHGSYGVLAKSSDFQPNPDHTFNCPGFSEGTRGTDRACCKFWTYFRWYLSGEDYLTIYLFIYLFTIQWREKIK